MIKLRNTLFVTRQGSYLHKEKATLVVEAEKKKLLQVPIHSISSIFCFGNVLVSPFFMGFCGEEGVNLAFYTEYGKYLGRLQSRQSGNILLRKQQYRAVNDRPLDIARSLIAAKVVNSRAVVQRHLRNHGHNPALQQVIKQMALVLERIRVCTTMDKLRGLEGEAASYYFSTFEQMIQPGRRGDFPFKGRNRRPPRDAVNAMLSLLYSILGKEIAGALQGVGLDPQAGFLHVDRPGRDSLAQDMLEEFRSWWLDRLVLSLVNRRQIAARDFRHEASGAVTLNDNGRKTVLQAYQAKKQETLMHPYMQEKVPIGLLPHIQSQLLARHLRGDLAAYPPFIMR